MIISAYNTEIIFLLKSMIKGHKRFWSVLPDLFYQNLHKICDTIYERQSTDLDTIYVISYQNFHNNNKY